MKDYSVSLALLLQMILRTDPLLSYKGVIKFWAVFPDGIVFLETHADDGISLGINSTVSLATEYGTFDAVSGAIILGEIPTIEVSELGGSRSGSDVQNDNLFAILLPGWFVISGRRACRWAGGDMTSCDGEKYPEEKDLPAERGRFILLLIA